MSIKMSTPLADSLNTLQKVATNILDQEYNYRRSKKLAEDTREIDFKWKQRENADAKDIVYKDDGSIDWKVTDNKIQYTKKYKEVGTNNAKLNTHSWWLDTKKLPSGEIVGVDNTPEQLTKEDLDADTDAIRAIINGTNDELTDHDIKGLMYYGIFDDSDDELHIGGQEEEMIAEIRAGYSDEFMGPKIRSIIGRRWDIISQGILENKQFKDKDSVMKYRADKITLAGATISALGEQNYIQNVATSLNSVRTGLKNPEGARLGSMLFNSIDDEGKTQWFDRDGNKLDRDEFEGQYKIAYGIINSGDPVRAFTKAYNDVPEEQRGNFLETFKKESPELYETMITSKEQFATYAMYQSAHDAIIRSGIGDTRVDLSVFEGNGGDLRRGLKNIKNNSAISVSKTDLSGIDIDSKTDELVGAGIPSTYMIGTPEVLASGTTEEAVISYKSDLIDRMFNKDTTSQWKESLLHAEADKGFSETSNSAKVTLSEIKESIGSDNWAEYENWKIEIDDEYKDLILENRIEPGWSSDQVIKGVKEYTQAIVEVQRTHKRRQDLLPELENWYTKWQDFANRANSMSQGVEGVGQGADWRNPDASDGIKWEAVGGDNFFRAHPAFKEEYLALSEEHDILMNSFTGLDQKTDFDWTDYPDLMLKNIRAGAQRGEGMVYRHGGGIVGVPGEWAQETTGTVSGAPWDDTMQTSQLQIPHILGHSRIHPDMFNDETNSWYVTYFGSEGLEMKATGAGPYNMAGGYVSSHELGPTSLVPKYDAQNREYIGASPIYAGGPSDLLERGGERNPASTSSDVMGSLSLGALFNERRPGAGPYDRPGRREGVGEDAGWAGNYAWEDLVRMSEGEGEAANYANALIKLGVARSKVEAMYDMGDFEGLNDLYKTNSLNELVEDIKRGLGD